MKIGNKKGPQRLISNLSSPQKWILYTKMGLAIFIVKMPGKAFVPPANAKKGIWHL